MLRALRRPAARRPEQELRSRDLRGGHLRFGGWQTEAGDIVVDLRSSVVQAICFVRMSRLRPAYLAAGRVVGYGTARKPLLAVTSMEPVPGGASIRPNAVLPRGFVETVLYVLRLEIKTGRKV